MQRNLFNAVSLSENPPNKIVVAITMPPRRRTGFEVVLLHVTRHEPKRTLTNAMRATGPVRNNAFFKGWIMVVSVAESPIKNDRRIIDSGEATYILYLELRRG